VPRTAESTRLRRVAAAMDGLTPRAASAIRESVRVGTAVVPPQRNAPDSESLSWLRDGGAA
jgi:hypothetical protein